MKAKLKSQAHIVKFGGEVASQTGSSVKVNVSINAQWFFSQAPAYKKEMIATLVRLNKRLGKQRIEVH